MAGLLLQKVETLWVIIGAAAVSLKRMLRPDSIVPEIFVHDGPGALEFYKRGFGAFECSQMMSPDGKKRLHGELEIRGHCLFVCDELSASEGGT